MSRKFSYVSAIDVALSVLSGMDAEAPAIPAQGEGEAVTMGEVVEKLTALREAQAKRSASKKAEGESKTHKANVELAEKVIAVMVPGVVYDNKGIKSLLPAELAELNPQKLAPIMACLGERIVRSKVKGKVSYSLA